MDKVLVFGTKDCRFESCQGHLTIAIVTKPRLVHVFVNIMQATVVVHLDVQMDPLKSPMLNFIMRRL